MAPSHPHPRPRPSPASGEVSVPGPDIKVSQPKGQASAGDCYARHTAPGLRSAPLSRGTGAGAPKPSWP